MSGRRLDTGREPRRKLQRAPLAAGRLHGAFAFPVWRATSPRRSGVLQPRIRNPIRRCCRCALIGSQIGQFMAAAGEENLLYVATHAP